MARAWARAGSSGEEQRPEQRHQQRRARETADALKAEGWEFADIEAARLATVRTDALEQLQAARIAAALAAGEAERGDVVVFDGRGYFAPSAEDGDRYWVKRVIAVGGDSGFGSFGDPDRAGLTQRPEGGVRERIPAPAE